MVELICSLGIISIISGAFLHIFLITARIEERAYDRTVVENIGRDVKEAIITGNSYDQYYTKEGNGLQVPARYAVSVAVGSSSSVEQSHTSVEVGVKKEIEIDQNISHTISVTDTQVVVNGGIPLPNSNNCRNLIIKPGSNRYDPQVSIKNTSSQDINVYIFSNFNNVVYDNESTSAVYLINNYAKAEQKNYRVDTITIEDTTDGRTDYALSVRSYR